MNRERYLRDFKAGGRRYDMFDIERLTVDGIADIGRLPLSIRILVENLLRKLDGHVVNENDLLNIARWQRRYQTPVEIPYHPARVLMQDFTGVPAVVDLAALRDAVKKFGGDPRRVNPLVPVDLVIDHSIQVDAFGTVEAAALNARKEYERNAERYAFLKWAQQAFDNFTVVPPGTGICHQVNLECISRVVMTAVDAGRTLAYPDTLVGLDSHTTMINAVGVMGWGVGGIEAEAVMLGQPYYMAIPEVIGVRLTGELRPGVTATDLVLTVTEMLRHYGVVEKFVEYFGDGMEKLTIPDRATLSNMAPEYGATLGFFPVDRKTIDYLRLTNRKQQAELVEAYTRENGLFYLGGETPDYTDIVELDLNSVEPCVAGPARPRDRIALKDLKSRFADIVGGGIEENETAAPVTRYRNKTDRKSSPLPPTDNAAHIELNGRPVTLDNGSVVIAAITSCTNTSNPYVLLGTGLLAKKAVERGLKVPAFVKTSLAPGSRVVMRYLEDAGLLPYLQALGFHLAGYGCTTCIGNSGPLHPAIEKCIRENDLNTASVISGNRNFEARIHQSVKSNFLASPMLVVAYALAGRVDIDITSDPVGLDPNGRPVLLKQIWPDNKEIEDLAVRHIKEGLFEAEYGRIHNGDANWQRLPHARSVTYQWETRSTYIKKPPYLEDVKIEPDPVEAISEARALVVAGDAVTTDHISPAGAIPRQYPAGQYLAAQGVEAADFNSYGSRRGNHDVMIRGTFGNIRLKNQLAGGKEGGYTIKLPEGEPGFIYDVAMAYQQTRTPMVVLAGREYGTGSSRDWAAKGTNLLGVRAVVAESFERIHRSNLVGMGILPLVFESGANLNKLGLDGRERFAIEGIESIQPRQRFTVTAVKPDGSRIVFQVIARLDTDVDVAYFKNGGILPYVLRKILA